MTMHVLDQSQRRRPTTGYRAFLLREGRALRAAEAAEETAPRPMYDAFKRQEVPTLDGTRRTREFLRIERGVRA